MIIILSLLAALSLPDIEIHGHRGARASMPVKTIPAFAFAVENGADVLEMDVVATADDILVVHHDLKINANLCRNRDGSRIEESLWIRSLSFEQVKSFDCGSSSHPQFPKQRQIPGTKIPSLMEVFEWVKGSKLAMAGQVKFNIEPKSVPADSIRSPSPSSYARLLVDVIHQFEFEKRVIIQSFDHRVLREVKEIQPKILTSALIAQNYLIDLVRVARIASADIISPNAEWITREQVKTLRAIGLKVIPWTVNDPEDWRRMADFDIDGIITDDPKGLKAFLDSRIQK